MGIHELSGAYFSQIRCGAKTRGLEFNITIQYVWDLFEKQNFKCALSGLPITLYRNWTKKKNENSTASLDRVDSSKGYVDPSGLPALIFSLRAQLQLGLKITTLIESGIPSAEWTPYFPKIWPRTLEKRKNGEERRKRDYLAAKQEWTD